MMTSLINDWILEASRWLWDYYLLATVLLVVVLIAGKLVAQPARRMAIHWSAAAGLLPLALLCAVPGWSIVHMLSPAPNPFPVWVEDLAPLDAAIPTAPFPSLLSQAQPPVAIPTEMATVDYGVLSLYVIAAGSLIFLLWLVLGTWQVYRMRSQAKSAPPELVVLLTKLSTNDRVPELGVVSKLPVAAAVGLRHPMVLLPQSSLKLSSPEKLRTVLAHELAHIRHRDLWLLALLRGLLLILWPQPLYWLWRRNVRLDQETLADAAAAEVTNRTDYAEQLIAWARVSSKARMPRLASSIGLWESPSQLKRRIAILLDERLMVLRNCSQRWRLACAAAATFAVVLLSLVTLQPPIDAAENILSDASAKAEKANGDDEGDRDDDSKEIEGGYSLLEVFHIAADEGVIRRLDPRRVTLGLLLPDDLTVYAVYKFDPRELLAKAKPTFDSKVGHKDALANVLRGIEFDPYGPRINVEKEIISKLAGQITVLAFKQDAAVPEPIAWLIAVQTNNERAFAATVDHFMQSDPNASLGNLSGRRVWRIRNEEDVKYLACVEFEHLLITNAESLLQKQFAKNSVKKTSASATEN